MVFTTSSVLLVHWDPASFTEFNIFGQNGERRKSANDFRCIMYMRSGHMCRLKSKRSGVRSPIDPLFLNLVTYGPKSVVAPTVYNTQPCALG